MTSLLESVPTTSTTPPRMAVTLAAPEAALPAS